MATYQISSQSDIPQLKDSNIPFSIYDFSYNSNITLKNNITNKTNGKNKIKIKPPKNTINYDFNVSEYGFIDNYFRKPIKVSNAEHASVFRRGIQFGPYIISDIPINSQSMSILSTNYNEEKNGIIYDQGLSPSCLLASSLQSLHSKIIQKYSVLNNIRFDFSLVSNCLLCDNNENSPFAFTSQQYDKFLSSVQLNNILNGLGKDNKPLITTEFGLRQYSDEAKDKIDSFISHSLVNYLFGIHPEMPDTLFERINIISTLNTQTASIEKYFTPIFFRCVRDSGSINTPQSTIFDSQQYIAFQNCQDTQYNINFNQVSNCSLIFKITNMRLTEIKHIKKPAQVKQILNNGLRPIVTVNSNIIPLLQNRYANNQTELNFIFGIDNNDQAKYIHNIYEYVDNQPNLSDIDKQDLIQASTQLANDSLKIRIKSIYDNPITLDYNDLVGGDSPHALALIGYTEENKTFQYNDGNETFTYVKPVTTWIIQNSWGPDGAVYITIEIPDVAWEDPRHKPISLCPDAADIGFFPYDFDVELFVPDSARLPGDLIGAAETRLIDNFLSENCNEPNPSPSNEPSPSPSSEPPFIKVCGFGFEPEIDDAFLRNGTYSYYGIENGYPVWQNLNGYELKFDLSRQSYVLGVINNPYDYYLYGTTSPIGSTWKNISNGDVNATTSIDNDPFNPCPSP